MHDSLDGLTYVIGTIEASQCNLWNNLVKQFEEKYLKRKLYETIDTACCAYSSG